MGGQSHTLEHRPNNQDLLALAPTYTLHRKVFLWAMCIDQQDPPGINICI